MPVQQKIQLDEIDRAILDFVNTAQETTIPEINRQVCPLRVEEFARRRVKRLHRAGLVEMVKFFNRVIVLPAGALDENEVTVE